MEHIQTKKFQSMRREDGQRCPIDIDEGTGEVRQKSAPFFAYNRENYKSKLKLAMDNPVANSIFEFFVSEMDNTNAICVSMSTMEKLFNLKRNAISKHIKYLENEKFISIFKIGNMNCYAVNAYIVWTKGDSKIWQAKFAATMYLDFDEQTDKVQREYSKSVSKRN